MKEDETPREAGDPKRFVFQLVGLKFVLINFVRSRLSPRPLFLSLDRIRSHPIPHRSNYGSHRLSINDRSFSMTDGATSFRNRSIELPKRLLCE